MNNLNEGKLMTYSISTIGMIVYFALVALADFSIWAAPAVLMGLVAAVIAIALVARR